MMGMVIKSVALVKISEFSIVLESQQEGQVEKRGDSNKYWEGRLLEQGYKIETLNSIGLLIKLR